MLVPVKLVLDCEQREIILSIAGSHEDAGNLHFEAFLEKLQVLSIAFFRIAGVDDLVLQVQLVRIEWRVHVVVRLS
jgi:hypothetical protein